MCRHSLRSDGEDSTSLRGVNTAFPREKLQQRSVSSHDLRHSNEKPLLSDLVLNRRLTLTAVQGILGRFSRFEPDMKLIRGIHNLSQAPQKGVC